MKQIRNTLIILVFVACLPVYSNALAEQPLYEKQGDAEGLFVARDEYILKGITTARLLMMSGEKTHSVAQITHIMEKLKEKPEHRRYRAVNMILVRFDGGRRAPYLYLPPSYKDTLYDTEAEEAMKFARDLLGDKQWDDVVVSLNMDYAVMYSGLAAARQLASSGQLEKADEIIQELYEDIIRGAELKHDPVRLINEGLKAAAELFNQKKNAEALKVLDDCEKLLDAFLKENPGVSFAKDLLKLKPGFEKIKTYKWDGSTSQVVNSRIKAARTLSDMRSKIKHIDINLPH